MKILSYIFAVVGLLALSYWAIVFVSAQRYQYRETQRFTSGQKAEPGTPSRSESPTNEKRSYPSTGSPVALLEIPRLRLSAVVVEGAEEHELKLGPGHIRGTSLPGEGGNVGVAGHRDTFFRPLRLIRRDDTIKVIAHEREYQYKVVSLQIVEPEDIEVLYPTGRETLTLVTCYPFDFVGSAPRRYIVRADCVECARPVSIAPGGPR
jgi:sortase A